MGSKAPSRKKKEPRRPGRGSSLFSTCGCGVLNAEVSQARTRRCILEMALAVGACEGSSRIFLVTHEATVNTFAVSLLHVLDDFWRLEDPVEGELLGKRERRLRENICSETSLQDPGVTSSKTCLGFCFPGMGLEKAEEIGLGSLELWGYEGALAAGTHSSRKPSLTTPGWVITSLCYA
ncbi:uncharacterized protein LOC144577966 isoform X1 [Callithrix jacchus]